MRVMTILHCNFGTILYSPPIYKTEERAYYIFFYGRNMKLLNIKECKDFRNEFEFIVEMDIENYLPSNTTEEVYTWNCIVYPEYLNPLEVINTFIKDNIKENIKNRAKDEISRIRSEINKKTETEILTV